MRAQLLKCLIVTLIDNVDFRVHFLAYLLFANVSIDGILNDHFFFSLKPKHIKRICCGLKLVPVFRCVHASL